MTSIRKIPTINRQPTLTGPTVIVRPLCVDDADDLYLVAQDPMLWEQHTDKYRWQRPVFDAFFQDAIKSGGALAIVARETERLIGTTRLHLTPQNLIEVGWTFLTRSYWGDGTNWEVKTLLLDFVFQTEDTVIFRASKHNVRSRKAIEKLGAILEHGFEGPRGPAVQYQLAAVTWKMNNSGRIQ